MTGHDIKYISYGAGTQSTAMLIMSALGMHGCPKADVAIFADTQSEPRWVYKTLETMEPWAAYHGIPIKRVTVGNLGQDAIDRHNGTRSRFATVPVFTTGKNGESVPLRRQCTREYKIAPIETAVRRLLGVEYRKRIGKKRALCMIGISLDEMVRAKPSRTKWVDVIHPLIDARLNVHGCRKIITDNGFPVPRKSSCYFCPYHSETYWRDLKQTEPDTFELACQWDEKIRGMEASSVKNPVYVHRSLTPLRDVNLKEDQDTFDWFDDECHGICGV